MSGMRGTPRVQPLSCTKAIMWICARWHPTLQIQLAAQCEYSGILRALGLYYSDKASLQPPELNDMIAKGGLLDLSAEIHQSLHGIPLVGSDHVLFSHWNYPDKREDAHRSLAQLEAYEFSVCVSSEMCKDLKSCEDLIPYEGSEAQKRPATEKPTRETPVTCSSPSVS